MIGKINKYTPYNPILVGMSSTLSLNSQINTIAHNTCRILWVSTGSCTVNVQNEHHQLIGSRMLLFHSNTSYFIEKENEEFFCNYIDIGFEKGSAYDFSTVNLSNSYPNFLSFMQSATTCYEFRDTNAIIATTFSSLQAYTKLPHHQRKNYISLSLMFMIAYISSNIWNEDRKTAHYNRHVRSAIKFIYENYMESINAQIIADSIGIHVGHLHRIFIAETGTHICKFITDARIDKAKDLLMRTDLSLTCVAERCGFSSLQYFYRVFKNETGKTPKLFRSSYATTSDHESALPYYIDNIDMDHPPTMRIK